VITLLPYRVEARVAVTLSTADRVELLSAHPGYVMCEEQPAHSNSDAPVEWEVRFEVHAACEEAASGWLRAECARVGLTVLAVQALRLPVLRAA